MQLHRLLLTGTPLQNNLHELWNVLHVLLPDYFTSADAFDEAVDVANHRVDAERLESARQLLGHFMLHRTKEVVGLPRKYETLVPCPLAPLQASWYKRLLASDTATASVLTVSQLKTLIMQLRKICNHPRTLLGSAKDSAAAAAAGAAAAAAVSSSSKAPTGGGGKRGERLLRERPGAPDSRALRGHSPCAERVCVCSQHLQASPGQSAAAAPTAAADKAAADKKAAEKVAAEKRAAEKAVADEDDKEPSEAEKQAELERLLQVTVPVHLISTPYSVRAGFDKARVTKEDNHNPPHSYCYNPNTDSPQDAGGGWLQSWIKVCKRTVYVVFNRRKNGNYGDGKYKGWFDGQAQGGEVELAETLGCTISWVGYNP